MSAADRKHQPVRRAFARGAVARLVVLLMLLGCGGGAPHEKGQRTVLFKTAAHDEVVGREAAQGIGAEMGYVDDPALEAYISEVGRRLARYAPRGRFRYQFKVIDQEVPNAFALPGGYISVSRGLLALTNSEDELAGVLSHEIIHVAAGHAAARQAMMEQTPGLLRVFSSGAFASYSRDQEREADRLGQGLAGLAGYDPNGLPTFLQQLNREERLQLGGSRMAGFGDTHPATSERIGSASGRAGRVAWERVPLVAGDRAGFLNRIEGLVVGATGDKGFFRGDLFLHPEKGFALHFPTSWLTQNSLQAAAAVAPQRDGVFMLRQGGEGDDALAYAQKFLEDPANKGFVVLEEKTDMIGGVPSVQLAGTTGSARGLVHVQMSFVPHRGSMYILTGMSLGKASYKEVFLNATRSFGPLTAEQREKTQELRLRIATAQSGESLPSLSVRTGNVWDVQQVAVRNAMTTTGKLARGALVKVAVPTRHAAQ